MRDLHWRWEAPEFSLRDYRTLREVVMILVRNIYLRTVFDGFRRASPAGLFFGSHPEVTGTWVGLIRSS